MPTKKPEALREMKSEDLEQQLVVLTEIGRASCRERV